MSSLGACLSGLASILFIQVAGARSSTHFISKGLFVLEAVVDYEGRFVDIQVGCSFRGAILSNCVFNQGLIALILYHV